MNDKINKAPVTYEDWIDLAADRFKPITAKDIEVRINDNRASQGYITKKSLSSPTPSGQGRNWYGDYDPNNTTGWQEKGLHMDSQGNESNPVDRGEMSSGEYQMKLEALETQNYMTNYGTNVMKTAVPTGGFQRESTLSNIFCERFHLNSEDFLFAPDV